ncbi:hypothetical protein ACHAXR_004837, partial [Thalassiosira sp. AJA248-18]
MYGDPPDAKSRRLRDPPPSSSNRRVGSGEQKNQNISPRNESQRSHHYLLDASNESSHVALPQHYSSFHQQSYNQPRHDPTNTAHSGIGRDRPTLRRRGSSNDRSADRESYYRHDHYNGDDDRIQEIEKRRNDQFTTKNTTSNSPLSRILALIICMLLLWVSYWGIETGISLAMGHLHIVFGNRHTLESYPRKQSFTESEIVHGDHQSLIQEANSAGLRGAPESDASKGLSVHDLNARSHLLKAEGRQLINDRGLENDEDGKGDKSYMGHDATTDFFFAGAIVEKKRIVNTKGRIESITYPAHSYATLPVLIDGNQFAFSIWIYLSPLAESEQKAEDKPRPRVILSTRSYDDRGCQSDVFGEKLAAGMVLYAQLHYDDSVEVSGDARTYRIILEYAQYENKLCHTLFGTQHDTPLVREGQWHHIAFFATGIGSAGDERISLYVNGDIAGRKDQESRRFSSPHTETRTVIGRYATQVGSKFEPSSNRFDLGGRVGMLSFWETGGHSHALSKEAKRMKIQSQKDEDHVVRAILRAAFDIQAIHELSLQGLTVKEPTLIYTFDGQKDIAISKTISQDDLYSNSRIKVNEAMMGLSGSIISEQKDGMPAHQKQSFMQSFMQSFVPLGANRYAEYKGGDFFPPKITASERKELSEVAQARSVLVKKAMRHTWKGYKKYAYGKDELLPLSKEGQDNWGGMGTTLVDSLSTLWMMGMKKEFWEARDWVRDHLDFGRFKGGVSVFETTIRNLGGLLSAYDLSGDKAFLAKADDLGMRLMRAFDSRTGIPYGEAELFDGGRAYNAGWHRNDAVLSEIGTLQVEFRYLAKVTGKSEYETKVMRALDELLKLDPESGLYPTYISNTKQDLGFGNSDISIGAMGDSFYEYLLKVWLQGGKQEMNYRRMYDKSVKGIMDKLIHQSRPSYLTYVAELKNNRVVHKMDHLSCFLGGTLALGAYTHPDGLESMI